MSAESQLQPAPAFYQPGGAVDQFLYHRLDTSSFDGLTDR
ncbi:hypothetical protein EDC27_2724 [Desulfosoma caldarium]|uniref:Uncharacterized protein n=1 Tax=Desulfosoma caldarium TaxID=610254 RepID=A0A3N1UQH0_9BACT|nr:hypothetical protein EDC27_2724 [Desulfosoma caldarium]